jgi:S1-C subfamily serine protease
MAMLKRLVDQIAFELSCVRWGTSIIWGVLLGGVVSVSLFLHAALRLYLLVLIVTITLAAFAVRPAAAGPQTPLEMTIHHRLAKIRAWSRAVVELKLQINDNEAIIGTGVYVHVRNLAGEDTFYLLTADHVIADGGESLGSKLAFRSFNSDPDANEWRMVSEITNKLTRFSSVDLAVFQLNGPVNGLVPLELATESPAEGQRVEAFGYAVDTGHAFAGEVVGRSTEGNFMALKIGADHGDSGGPLVDQEGHLVGLISSDASPAMTDYFTRTPGPDTEHPQVSWTRAGRWLGADTIAVDLPETLRHLAEAVQNNSNN